VIEPDLLIVCTTCGAVTTRFYLDDHKRWHEEHHHRRAPDETLRLPPIGDTVRRRPPVPGVRDLKGAELLRALADELEADADVDGDDL
jgi:hypothetical protein